MFVEPLTSLGTEHECFMAGEQYEVPDAIGAMWIRQGVAVRTATAPRVIQRLLDRLELGAGKTCMFLPFVGEFGHVILTHTRIVHFHKAARKIVCCRPGEQVLYPSADVYVTTWEDPIPDKIRIATIRERAIVWTGLLKNFPDAVPIPAGNLTPSQELHYIHAEAGQIPFRPVPRNLRPDVVLGVRRREIFPERNWAHWEALARAISDAGYTFAVMGHRQTSFDLPGQLYHTGWLDTDAAVESLQNCKLYIGTDSGGSHLAAAVGAPMLVFRESDTWSRDLRVLMKERNPNVCEVVPDDAGAWNRPEVVIDAALKQLQIANCKSQIPCAQAN